MYIFLRVSLNSKNNSASINPFMPSGAFNICCPRDCVSRTANVERTARHYWVNRLTLVAVYIYVNNSSYIANYCTTWNILWIFHVHVYSSNNGKTKKINPGCCVDTFKTAIFQSKIAIFWYQVKKNWKNIIKKIKKKTYKKKLRKKTHKKKLEKKYNFF